MGDGPLAWPDGLIFWQVRVPRTMLAVLVGGGQGLSGAVLQGALRNPLADPGLLGITGTAALGAVVVFYWGLAQHFAPALTLGGLAGAGVGAALLLRFAGGARSAPSLILAGVAVSAIAAALLAVALTLAPNPYALTEITFWLMGGLADRPLWQVALAAVPILAGIAILLRLGPGLDALSLGEDTARSLGVPVPQTLRLAALGTALAAGAGAAVAGSIGFIGLVVPHLLRPRCGDRPGALLAPSPIAGAALLLAADMLVRLAPLALLLSASPPIGVLTALLGAPFLGDRPQGGCAVIGVSHLPVRLGGRTVLHDVSFSPGPAELVALCGPNGAGKSTLLRALAGLLPGTVAPDPRRVAYLPQGARSSWNLSVEQVAVLGRIPHRDRAETPVTRALELCGIIALRAARIDRISGGEARSAMRARAFATEPDVFLLDEPTADLDPTASHAIMRLLRQTAGAGRTVVVVLHALDLALRFADRVAVLAEGHIVADLPAAQALPVAAAAFGMRFGTDPEPRLLPPL